MGVTNHLLTGMIPEGARKGVLLTYLLPTVYIVFDLGILGDEKTHRYPRVIGLINRDFPYRDFQLSPDSPDRKMQPLPWKVLEPIHLLHLLLGLG